MLTYIHIYIHTYIHTYIHIYVHAYVHTYIRTYIHIYTYIHTFYLTQGYFSQRMALMSTNSVSIERMVTKGCPQGSCCGPGFWNMLYNSLLKMEFTSHSKAIAFAGDLIILTKGESIVDAENYMNMELRKISDWAQNNKLKFNEHKSKVMLMSCRKRKENK